MNNVITALGNPILNEELQKIDEVNVLLNDLQYKEAIIEFLEKKVRINYIVLSESLPGEIELNKLVNAVKENNKNIKIILIKEEKNEIKKNIQEIKNIDYIFYNNEVDVTDIIKIINNKKSYENERLKQDIEMLKEIVLKKNKKSIKNIKINEFSKKNEDNKIITVLGGTGVGKSIFTIMMSRILAKQNKKSLIIDFDILNNNIHTILGKKKYSNKIQNTKNNGYANIIIDDKLNNNITHEKIKNKINKKTSNKINYKESSDLINKINHKKFNDNKNYKINNEYKFNDFIININSNVDLISGLDLLFQNNNQIDCEEIIKKIKKIKNDYDYILIDTSSECFFEYNKKLILMSDISVFLLEANLLEIKKARKLLDIYEKEWKIKKDKIKIIINKYNNNSIKDHVLLNLFKGQEIIGKIQMSNYYNYLINKNNKLLIEKNNVKNEYIKISEKILKVNFNQNENIIKKTYKKIIDNLFILKDKF